jgi:hypothetical protein
MKKSEFILITSVILALVQLSLGHQIKVTNRCQQTLWIGTHGDDDIPAGGAFRLEPNQENTFNAINGWTSGRVWGKTGCNDAGQNCVTGESPPGGRTTLQPVTLAEFGLDKYLGMDYYDISLVDGFNLPLTIQPFGVNLEGNCKPLSCNFDFNVCPESFKQYADNRVVACNSACSATREPQYCCPTPPFTPETCSPSEYSQIFKNQCPDAYSYAYDDPTSIWVCNGQAPGSSGYEVIFCP